MNLEDVRILLLTLGSAKEVVQHILSMNRDKQQLVISLLWAWWIGRNKANVGDRAPLVLEIASRAYVLAAEFLTTRKEQPSISGESIIKVNKWNPPPIDVLKINSDGSFHEKEKMYRCLEFCGAR